MLPNLKSREGMNSRHGKFRVDTSPAALRAGVGYRGSPAPSRNSRRYEVHGSDGAAELA